MELPKVFPLPVIKEWIDKTEFLERFLVYKCPLVGGSAGFSFTSVLRLRLNPE